MIGSERNRASRDAPSDGAGVRRRYFGMARFGRGGCLALAMSALIAQLAMADGFAQSTGKPTLVNLHTSAGTGNAMGSLVAAYKGNTPLIVTAGQQTREMVLCDPYLSNPEPSLMPLPWVKWAYEPKRAEDVPAAFMRAYTVALQPPAGPVFLSIPLDDWEKPALGPAVIRTASSRVAPDAERLRGFADRINRAQRPLLVFGPEVDRAGAWDAGVAVAEKVAGPVYSGPLPDRASFPENHPLYQGMLPLTVAGVSPAFPIMTYCPGGNCTDMLPAFAAPMVVVVPELK